jgi:hypothetical protein
MDQTRDVITLDCSSVEDAITSLGRLFGMSPEDLRKALEHLEIDWHHCSLAPEDQVALHLGYGSVHDLPKPKAIRWFHAARVPFGTTFEEGLLPTPAALPKLWESLGAVAAQWTPAAEWNDYQHSFEDSDRRSAQRFRQKRMAPGWGGPFAFLVRDAALHKVGNHKDFTRICEALEDICADYEEVFGRPLREAYEAATSPCLVVFTRPGDYFGAVRAALNYAHRTVAGLNQSLDSNANFNGEGDAVPRSWIGYVEWL